MFHGYGGSNIHHVNLYSGLMKIFRVVSVDLPGMGLSSKKSYI